MHDSESPLHEGSHIRLRGLIIFFAWFFVALVLIHAAIYGVYQLYRSQAAQTNVPITGLSGEVTRSIPPEPRLQPSIDHNALPAEDLAKMRARDLEDFRRRGWVAEGTSEIVIPQSIVDQIALISQPAGKAK